jgi:ParB family chromosome partitioning protein
MKVKIDDIKIRNRYRKELGDVEDLKDSMTTLGLLQPVVLTTDNQLIAGCRRIEAAKQLGWKTIEAVKTDNLTETIDLLRAEHDENVCRKPFLNSEETRLYQVIRQIEQKKAGEREKTKRKQGQETFPDPGTKGQTRDLAAKPFGKSGKTMDAQLKILNTGDHDLIDLMDKHGAHSALKVIQAREREEAKRQQYETLPTKAHITQADCLDWLPLQKPCDLLLTDPPYSTDVKDLPAFVRQWLPMALDKIKPSGRGYIFCGAYPDELATYLSQPVPDHLTLAQVLVWQYRNTMGPQPTNTYFLNWQAILYFIGKDAPPLTAPNLIEQCAVQDVGAPRPNHHQWEKPMELAERFVRHSTKEGDTILDPFSCTGTFLLAGAKLGRHAFGCELSAENMALAVGRGCHVQD